MYRRFKPLDDLILLRLWRPDRARVSNAPTDGSGENLAEATAGARFGCTACTTACRQYARLMQLHSRSAADAESSRNHHGHEYIFYCFLAHDSPYFLY